MKEFRKNEQKLFICEECGKIFKIKTSLSYHINKCHLGQKHYYDKWLKEKNEGKCKICDKKTKFISLGCGYKKCCSLNCSGKYKQLRLEEENLKNFGVKNSYQRQDILEKKKKTNLEKLGVEFPMQSIICKEKRKQTYIKTIGVESPMKSIICREKSKKTCKKLYGVENISQNDNMKKKKEQTCLKNYGVKHPVQNKDILEKSFKTGRKLKQFRDTNIWYQGSYELDFLEKYYDKYLDIQRAPSIKYIFKDEEHWYHPDFYIPLINLIIECKNHYLAERDKEIIEAKEKATITKGFKYITILDKNYEDFNKLLII